MPELTFPSFPNEKALRAIERRGLNPEPSGNWYTVWQEAHQTAFTVAQSAGYDILSDIYNALHTAIADGITFREFRSSLEPILQKKGWWGRTDDGVQLGAPWRLKTIFQQNLRVSAAQGEWQEIQEVKQLRPYLRYSAIRDSRTRPLHAKWHGTILPVDHPWWQTHFPPNGWNCRCKVVSVDEDDLEFYDWKVSEQAPDDGSREWVNPATGERIIVPNGIDPGWAYNPGNVDQAAHSAKLAMDKLADMPPQMGAEAITKLALSFPQVERELTVWIAGITAQVVAGTLKSTGERRVVGALPDEAIEYARKQGVELATSAISVSDKDITHWLREGKFAPLPEELWNKLPSLLLEPEAIYWETRKDDLHALVYVIDYGTGKMVLQLNNSEKIKEQVGTKRKRRKIVTNTVRTGRRINDLEEFENEGRYTRLK